MASNTDTGQITALYNKVLGGRFFPEDGATTDQPKAAAEQGKSDIKDKLQVEESETSDGTVPELKTVIQFQDANGKHVIEYEGYKFNATENKDEEEEGNQEEEEEDPFKDYPVLLKAVLGKHKTLEWRLEIQSEGVINIFREIAKNYRELRLNSSVLVIEHPFRCLFFLRGELESRSHDPSHSRSTRIGLAQLLSFIKSPMCHQADIEAYENQVTTAGKVTFFMLWMLFPPFEPIVRVRRGQPIEDSQCFILESITPSNIRGVPQWKLNLYFGAHDGHDYEVKEKTKYIAYFDGFRQVDHHSLRWVPLRLLEQKSQTSIREAFIARGKFYMDTCKKSYSLWNYHGTAYLPNEGKSGEMRSMQSKKVVQLNERVIVDCAKQGAIGKVYANSGDVVASCISKALPQSKKRSEPSSDTTPPKTTPGLPALPSLMPEGWTQTRNDWTDFDPADYTKPKLPDLVDLDYLICRNVVIAFAMKQKIWVKQVLVNRLREIVFNEDPFKSLQFPTHRKLFIRRLVEGFKSGKESNYDDVIDGKGKGLIFLLYGPPGLGKTLTAESVAEVAQRPLYHVSAGELSTDVSSLEAELLKIFRMGARWNAVVLLDEADVLMSKRTTDNLERNSIIAVFLRMLEYYSGMLFLTTNRRDDFDDAFFNRIHVTIEYGQLDAMSRTNIWRHHLGRAVKGNTKPSTWTEDMYKALGKIPLNGRDIKNYVRTAHAFTRAAEGEDLSLEQVLIVLRNSLPGSNIPGISGSELELGAGQGLLEDLDNLVAKDEQE